MTTALLAPAPTRRQVRLRIPLSSEPQRRLWASDKRYIYFRGGRGSGKTFGGVIWDLSRPAGTTGIICAPTHKSLQGGVIATLMPIVERAGLLKRHHKQDGIVELTDGKEIYLRSLERPELTRGPNVHWVHGDELGIVKKVDAVDILLGCLRLEPAQLLVTTTPRGKLHWLHDRFAENARPETHEVIVSRTRDNPTFPCAHGAIPWRSCIYGCSGPIFEQELRKEYAEAFALQELDGEEIDLGAVDVYDVERLIVRQLPPSDLTKTARGWDMAATGGAGDYTAGVLMSIDRENRIYIRDVVRGQWEPGERDQRIRRTAEGDGVSVSIWVPQERGTAGKSQAFVWIRLLAGFSVKAELESGEKVTRAGPLAAQMGEGNITLTCEPGRWEDYWHEGRRLNPEAARARFRKNMGMFPAGRTKDESDAAAQALQLIVKRDSGISVGRYRGG